MVKIVQTVLFGHQSLRRVYGSNNGEYWGGGGWAHGVGLFLVPPHTLIWLHPPDGDIFLVGLRKLCKICFLRRHQSLHRVYGSGNEIYWGGDGWAHGVGSFSSASHHQNLFAFTKWRYFLLVGKTKIIQKIVFDHQSLHRVYCSANEEYTEVVVAEHMVWDSFWCLHIP